MDLSIIYIQFAGLKKKLGRLKIILGLYFVMFYIVLFNGMT